MVEVFGSPKGVLTQECKGVDAVADKIRPQIVTRQVEKFKLTGFGPFLDVLEDVLREFKIKHPGAHADLSDAGVLCVRLVRGSVAQPSNHSWGTAIDLGFGGAVDPRGDGKTYQGLLDFYAIAKRHGLFWGAGFRTEDAMHFEASDQLVRSWAKAPVVADGKDSPETIPLDVLDRPVSDAVRIGNVTYAPVRELCEAAGLKVAYDASTRSVRVTRP
jgi:hypothetical protein